MRLCTVALFKYPQAVTMDNRIVNHLQHLVIT